MGAHLNLRKEIIPMRKNRDRYLLFLSLKDKEFALFSIDNFANDAVICLQGNPYTVQGMKNNVLKKTLEEARIEWKKLSNEGWEQFSKGLITGAVIQRIDAWLELIKFEPEKLQSNLLEKWKSPYDGITAACKGRINNNNGMNELILIEKNTTIPVGDTSSMLYLPGTVPRQRGKRMR